MKLQLRRGFVGITVIASVVAGCTSSEPEEEPAPEVAEEPIPEEEPAPLEEEPAFVEEPAMEEPMFEEPIEPVAEVYLESVFFDYDSHTVRGDATEVLRQVAESLRANPDVKVQIEGHCDERGSNEYNLALGERRAKAVLDFLVSEGVDSSQLDYVSFGEERPAVLGSGEDVWSKNRRVEFRRL